MMHLMLFTTAFSGSGIVPVICHLSGTLEQFLSDADAGATNDFVSTAGCHGDSLVQCFIHYVMVVPMDVLYTCYVFM